MNTQDIKRKIYCHTCDEPIPNDFQAKLHEGHNITETFVRLNISTTIQYRFEGEIVPKEIEHALLETVKRGKSGKKNRDLLREQVYARDKFACLSCGTNEYLTLDEIVPISKKGKREFNNCQTLCKSCNGRKGALIIDFRTDNENARLFREGKLKYQPHTYAEIKQRHNPDCLRHHTWVSVIKTSYQECSKCKLLRKRVLEVDDWKWYYSYDEKTWLKSTLKLPNRPKGYGTVTDVTNIIPIEITGKNIALEHNNYPQETYDWLNKIFPPDGIPNNLREHLEINRIFT
jgi:hypothetical protein